MLNQPTKMSPLSQTKINFKLKEREKDSESKDIAKLRTLPIYLCPYALYQVNHE